MPRALTALIFAAPFLFSLAPLASQEPAGDAMLSVTVESEDGADPEAGKAARLILEGRDPGTDYALTGLAPAIWLVPAGGDDASCEAWVNRLAGSPTAPPGVIDLNGYDIVQLAQDGTLALVDPQLNLATANIKSIVQMPAMPTHWS
ncbi:MAG: hypothetical protein WBA55_13175, partial [Allopontixanthobacter sediminis]